MVDAIFQFFAGTSDTSSRHFLKRMDRRCEKVEGTQEREGSSASGSSTATCWTGMREEALGVICVEAAR